MFGSEKNWIKILAMVARTTRISIEELGRMNYLRFFDLLDETKAMLREQNKKK